LMVLFEVEILQDLAAGRDVDCRIEFAQLQGSLGADNKEQCSANLGFMARLASAQYLCICLFHRLGELHDDRIHAPCRPLDDVGLEIVKDEMLPKVGAVWDPRHPLSEIFLQLCRQLLLISQLLDPTMNNGIDL